MIPKSLYAICHTRKCYIWDPVEVFESHRDAVETMERNCQDRVTKKPYACRLIRYDAQNPPRKKA